MRCIDAPRADHTGRPSRASRENKHGPKDKCRSGRPWLKHESARYVRSGNVTGLNTAFIIFSSADFTAIHTLMAEYVLPTIVGVPTVSPTSGSGHTIGLHDPGDVLNTQLPGLMRFELKLEHSA